MSNIKVNGYTFKKATLLKLILPPSENRSTLKGKNLLPF